MAGEAARLTLGTGSQYPITPRLSVPDAKTGAGDRRDSQTLSLDRDRLGRSRPCLGYGRLGSDGAASAARVTASSTRKLSTAPR
jgi:hypothetical protein